MSIFPVPQFFRLIPLRGSWLRVKTKGNISFLFDLFLFCFVLNSKLKSSSHLINYFKSELVTRLFQTKYFAFLTTCWSISPRASVLPLLLVRFDAFSALRQQFSATVWIWILTSKYVSNILWHCMIYASMRFVKIFLLNSFDFWRQNFSVFVRPCYLYFWSVLTRFRLSVNIFRQHDDFEFWLQNMFRIFSDDVWYTPLWDLSKFFFLIILIFDGRIFLLFLLFFYLDSPVVTRSSTFVLTTCRKFCS